MQRGFWSFGLITHCQSKDLRVYPDHICTDPYPTLGTDWHDNILGASAIYDDGPLGDLDSLAEELQKQSDI